jgi:hypothetical protein
MRRRAVLSGLLVGLGGCSSLPGQADPNQSDSGGPISNYQARLEYRDGLKAAVIVVSVEASLDGDGLTILLADGDSNTVASTFISEEDLLDGRDSAELDISEPPQPGTYTLQFIQGRQFESDPQLLREEKFIIPPQKAEIRSISVDIEESSVGDGYNMTSASATVANTGEIPLQIDTLEMSVSGETGTLIGIEVFLIEPGEQREFSTDSGFSLPTVPAASDRLTVVASYQGKVHAKATKEINPD